MSFPPDSHSRRNIRADSAFVKATGCSIEMTHPFRRNGAASLSLKSGPLWAAEECMWLFNDSPAGSRRVALQNLPALLRAPAEEDDGDRPQQDLDVQPERPVVDVLAGRAATQSSKLLIWLRPLTCHRQVSPGFMLQAPALRRGVEFLHFVDGQRRGPDQAHVAFQHVQSCGVRPSCVLRKNFPICVTRGSFSTLEYGPCIWLKRSVPPAHCRIGAAWSGICTW